MNWKQIGKYAIELGHLRISKANVGNDKWRYCLHNGLKMIFADSPDELKEKAENAEVCYAALAAEIADEIK